MTRLSVNLNKVALIRNSRGANYPDLIAYAEDCERFGAQGITVHPRPDERHVRYSDLAPLKEVVQTEFNIEGYPDDRFMKKVKEIKPHQCTLVPDPPGVLTSDSGWDTIGHSEFLKRIVRELKNSGIRVSLFVDPIEQYVEGAFRSGADRIELYTGKYAMEYAEDREKAILPHVRSAALANSLGLGVNAGHDLNLENLTYFKEQVHPLHEVSIGHALTCDSLYFGLQNCIQMYLHKLGY